MTVVPPPGPPGRLPPARALSQSLAALVRDHGQGRRLVEIPPHLQVEAGLALPNLEALCRPAGAQAVREWLIPFASGCGAQVADEEFLSRSDVIGMACAHLPHSVLTSATQREGLATFPFFPSTKEVLDLLRPHCRHTVVERDALRHITSFAAPPAAPERTGPNLAAEERDAVLAKFRADMAVSRAENAPSEPVEPVKVRPFHHNDEVLLERYTALAAEPVNEFRFAAATRRDMLRQKLGIETMPEQP